MNPIETTCNKGTLEKNIQTLRPAGLRAIENLFQRPYTGGIHIVYYLILAIRLNILGDLFSVH